MDLKGRFVLPPVSTRLQHTCCGATTCLSVCTAVGLLCSSCPHRRPIVKTPGQCCLIAKVASSLSWNNSSPKQSHSIACILVFN